ncbi:hypothetical protein MUP51_01050 [Candidatus Bathyarchaeota archaeon]|nr:hypothetical protein [Candidatus Bathyarchaeota archaeon]
MAAEIAEMHETAALLSIRKREDFRENLIESIEEILSFSKVILNFLELNTPFKKSSIIEYPDVFCCELEDLFGDSARGIEDLILERLYKKINIKYEKDRNKKFEEYVHGALKLYIEYY